MDNKIKYCGYTLMGVLCLILVYSGGFFDYVTCFSSIIMMILFCILSFQRKRIILPWNLDALAFVCGAGACLIVPLWAVDSGMAVFGFFRFLPVVLFLVLLYQFEGLREKLLDILPVTGVLMTLFTSVMACFRSFASLVVVNHRLAGTFQYPNTFAIFLLVCLILVCKDSFKDKMNIAYAMVLLYGIYRSGSLTTYILTATVIGIYLAWNKKTRKIIFGVYVVLLIAAVVLVLSGHTGINLTGKMSTFTGRLLYAKDALPLIATHPFGLGYYGYYFMEQSVQTGVYTVLNVHNELLQFLLDIGWAPALFLFFVLVRAIFTREVSQFVTYRVALGALLAHSLFDFDLQFFSIWMIVVLLLPKRGTKEIKFGRVLYGAEILCSISVIAGAVVCGLANLAYMRGNYKRAVQMHPSYTIARIQLISESENVVDMKKQAELIEKENTHVSLVYDVYAQCAYSEGNMENYIRYKQQALTMNPYRYEGYLEYMNTLLSACSKYLDAGEKDSAKICMKRMKAVDSMLEKTAEKTSPLAYKIKDKPSLTLPMEYNKLMNELEMKLDE